MAFNVFFSGPNGEDGGKQQENGVKQRRLEAASSTYNALLCVTTPPALVLGKAPIG